MEGTAQTPIKDLRASALKHYDEAGTAIFSHQSDIPKAINFYYDHREAIEEAGDPEDRKYRALKDYGNNSCKYNPDITNAIHFYFDEMGNRNGLEYYIGKLAYITLGMGLMIVILHLIQYLLQ